ncbi:MAG: NAD-dependent epimerase/dehydratase family protein [Acidobacteria bacterium]|nr:MAG: NAD-dependent epimerase/dehydratase family protein [Acidobacteriota bacterium]
MRVLLTGGSGFLGGHVALSLRDAGHEVALLVRRPGAVADLGPGFEIVRGDLLDPAAVERAVAGREAVVHLAGVVKRWLPDRTLFERVNVAGTLRLADAALRAGARRFVYCSSFFALGPTDGRRPADESLAHDGRPRNEYERTKLAADLEMRALQDRGLPIVILYPGIVYGPGRLTEGNLLAGVARDLLRGRLPGTIGPGDRQQCLAYAEDVAAGFVAALERAPDGSRYILGGENVTVRQALQIIAEAGGVEPPRREIPYWLARLIGHAYLLRARVLRIPPALTPDEVEIHARSWAYDSGRARRELGYRITPAREGLTRMVRWLIDEGHVPGRADGGVR